MPLDELLAAEGLEGRIDEVVAWARARADEILASEALDDELVELLGGGNGVHHEPVRTYVPSAAGNTQPGVPLPRPPVERAPLPPVPQRPDLAASHGDEPEDLEMLDEDDLELVEDLGSDEEEGASEPPSNGEEGAGEPPSDEARAHPPAIGAGESSPEWKRALIDAQGDEA